MAKLVTKTYADALFQLAVEENRVDELYSEVLGLVDILRSNPELDAMMRHPGVDKNEKLDTIENIFRGRVSDELCGLLHQTVINNRYTQIDGILECFIGMVKEHKRIGVAYVVTAVELSDEQKDKVEKKLIETSGYETMEMHYSVDKSLIGGMQIRLGDRVIDSTISTKINELARELRRIHVFC